MNHYENGEKLKKEGASPRRHRKKVVLFGVLAVVLCVLVVLGVRIGKRIGLITPPDGFTLIKTHRDSYAVASGPQPPPTYWDGAVYAEACAKEGVFAPNESFSLSFALGMEKAIGEGDLVIEVEGGEFALQSSPYAVENGKLVIADFTELGYNRESPLSFDVTFDPQFAKEWARGSVTVSVRLRLHDVDGFIAEAEAYMCEYGYETQDFLSDGDTLTIERGRFYYAFDGVETWIDNGSDMLFENMLMHHYNTWRIGGADFMRVYYEWMYNDTVLASITQYHEGQKTFGFQYSSKNIRYQKTDLVSDDEIWALMKEMQALRGDSQAQDVLAEKQMRLAEVLLAHMRSDGVISEEEYANELLWLSEVSSVTNGHPMYPGKMGEYARKLHKYIYTHED